MSEVKDVVYRTLSAKIHFVSTLVHRLESNINFEELNDKLAEECVTSLTTYVDNNKLESELFEEVQNLWKITDVIRHTNSNIYLKIMYVTSDETQTKYICVVEDNAQTFHDVSMDEYTESDVQDTLDVETEFQDLMNKNVPSRFDLLKNWMEETESNTASTIKEGPYAKYVDELIQHTVDEVQTENTLRVRITRDEDSGNYVLKIHSDDREEELSWELDTLRDNFISLLKKHFSEAEARASQLKSYIEQLKDKLKK